MSAPQLRFAFYADDFTGATDALEQLARAGLRARLFLSTPSVAQLARYPDLDAIGIAGFARSLAPDAMDHELRPAFNALRDLGVPHVHYKVCSTFDSSPTTGSIGRAIDIGADVFGGRFVPVLVGSPALGRFCVFGNLFARYGIGSAGAIHRLDRHPSVSRHPITPMTEADLRAHLAKQTRRRIGLVDVLQLGRGETEARAAVEATLAAGNEIVLFDTLEHSHLAIIGALLGPLGSLQQTLFSVGSSAVETALFGLNSTGVNATHAAAGERSSNSADASNFSTVTSATHAQSAPSQISAQRSLGSAGAPSATTLVISGSCSPVSDEQIQVARDNGFAAFAFEASSALADQVCASLEAGRSTIVYTSLGENSGVPLPAAQLGASLGKFARDVLCRTAVRRLVIAGGDTASYAARALGVDGLEIAAPLLPGAPLCRASIPGNVLDGLELVCKGGQVGAPDFFTVAASALSSR